MSNIRSSGGGIVSTGGSGAHQFELSPSLVLATALLHMMVGNGEVEESEVDQWKSVIGANADLAQSAVECVTTIPREQFFLDASKVLRMADKLCILTNMCDAMLSDGQSAYAEFELLVDCTEKFGVSDSQFLPFFAALVIKNDKSVLGELDRDALVALKLTPHLAWAAAMIYLLASDGSMGPQEIGRLQAMMGEFDGLPKAGVKYALKFKSEPFFILATEFLSHEQKTFILMNACDLLLSDGVEDAAEKAVFDRMRNAFGYTEAQFDAFRVALAAKNVKTFDTNSFVRTPNRGDTDAIDAGVMSGPSISPKSAFLALAKWVSVAMTVKGSEVVKIPPNFISAKNLHRLAINAGPSVPQSAAGSAPPSIENEALEPQGNWAAGPPHVSPNPLRSAGLPPGASGQAMARRGGKSVDRYRRAQVQAKIRDSLGSVPRFERFRHPALTALPHVKPLPVLAIASLTFVIAGLICSSLLYLLLEALRPGS